MHLPDSMVGNARLKLNNVRATTTNILGKLSTPPYNSSASLVEPSSYLPLLVALL